MIRTKTHSPTTLLAMGIAFAAMAMPLAQANDGTSHLAPTKPGTRTVELAICLDTSGSMDGLIDAARQKLWTIVNDLATATPTPDLRVALLTFGNDGHPAEQGWVRVDAPFTTDLDAISQQLFALRTNGGTELVGRVLDVSSRLAWTPGDDVLKVAIVAGNESADQDQEVPFREVCPRLIANGVIVNAIYCGPENDNIAPAWREVARLADGQFASIDHNQGLVIIETPFDAELSKLSMDVNGTFCWFGEAGVEACSNQVAQDKNAAGLNTAAVATRAQTKANGIYWNQNDLVHSVSNGTLKLDEVKKEDLPEEMREMTLIQQQEHLDKKAAERKAIEEKINELSKQREAFVDAEMKRRSLDDGRSFDNAVRGAIREQAKAKGFTWPAPDPAVTAPAEGAEEPGTEAAETEEAEIEAAKIEAADAEAIEKDAAGADAQVVGGVRG